MTVENALLVAGAPSISTECPPSGGPRSVRLEPDTTWCEKSSQCAPAVSAGGGHARDQLHQDVVVNRFDQMVVESSVCSFPPIVRLPPPGKGDQNGLYTGRRASNALGC